MSGNNGNATASFSGFLYQADIALWKTLEKITDIGITNNEKLEKWELEVEGEEDFTLYRKEEGKEEIRESYQVKETNKTKPGDYTEAVIKLFQENQKEGERKSILVTEKKIEVDKTNYIDFLNGLYSGDGLTQDQKKLRYLKKGIGEEGTFLSNKIEKNEKYEFNDTKENVAEFVNHKTQDFFDNDFDYIFGDNKDEVHKEINDLLKKLNGKINSEYHFRYLESKIKRFIQERKNNINSPNIQFTEIVEIIDKSSDEIVDEIVTSEFYHDIFINHFIYKFKHNFSDIYPGKNGLDLIVEEIYNELGIEDYIIFLDTIQCQISDYILSKNCAKIYSFIKHTIGHNNIDYIESSNSIENFDDFKNIISNFDATIYKKIQMIVAYFYAKSNCITLEDNIISEEEITFFIKNGLDVGVITGLLDSKKYLKDFLESRVFYEFEKTHIGIYGVKSTISKHLGEENIEIGFIEERENICDYHKEKRWNITDTKNIKIFSGKNCLKIVGERNANNFMN